MKSMPNKEAKPVSPANREHQTFSSGCWCHPTVEIGENGVRIIVHNYLH